MLDTYKDRIETRLSELIPISSPYFPTLYQAGRYTLLSPGKRIRPLLTLCVAEMLQKNSSESALIPACALELIHTYSLIHDDLPCMDDDDLRRGRPTLHRLYSEGHAVLTGDFLLTYAFEILATAPFLEAEQKINLVRVLATAAGGEGMIGGQVMDIEHSAEIARMHSLKTASLFDAACQFGAIVANSEPEEANHLKNFGLNFGRLFQMVDDILDEDHPLGRERAEEAALVFFHQCLDCLDYFEGNTAPMRELTTRVYDTALVT